MIVALVIVPLEVEEKLNSANLEGSDVGPRLRVSVAGQELLAAWNPTLAPFCESAELHAVRPFTTWFFSESWKAPQLESNP